VLFRLQDVHAATRERLGPGLFSDESLLRIDRAMAGLPDGQSFYGFECRLTDDRSEVDFGTGIAKDDGSRERVLAEPVDTDAAAWEAVRRLCAAWKASPSLDRLMRCVFTEIDLGGERDVVPPPSLFGRIDWLRQTNWSDELAVAESAALEFLVAAYGREIGPVPRAGFDLAVRSLPPNGWLHGIAAMLGRPGQPLRVGVWVPRWALREYLARIGLDSESDALMELVGLYPDARGPFVELALDLGHGVHPRVGIEFTMDRQQDHAGRFVSPLLDRMVEAGACAAEKAAALAAWPGRELVDLPGVGWPICVTRQLSHLKIVHEPEGGPLAKAYLTVTPAFTLAR